VLSEGGIDAEQIVIDEGASPAPGRALSGERGIAQVVPNL
jgi:hypothetical protein